MKLLCLVEFLFTIGFIEIYGDVDVTLTVNVLPGQRECFVQEIAANSQYGIEYQVVSGGELDILFTVDAAGDSAVTEIVKSSSDLLRDRATVSGEYEFCFDNSFSHISTKTVFFHITVTEEATATTDTDGTDEAQELLPFEITVENFRTSTHQVGDNLRRSTELQRAFSKVELRDRSIQEHNFERVNFWSALQLFIMMSATLVNILMIRGLFSDRHSTSSSNSKLHT